MRQQYEDKRFRSASLKQIEKMNAIIVEYTRSGDVLSVRQLYYQMVARGYIENTMKSYKNLASLANDARMAGLMDWDAIEDRHREFERRNRWDCGSQIIQAQSDWYHQDLWKGQPYRVFVIVEKAALVGALSNTCHDFDIPLLAAKGYPSSTVLREFVLRDLIPAAREGQECIILHLGDHDPSGIDMTRDLEEKIEIFGGGLARRMKLERIALNMEQIDEEKPPPNPAKTTDSRFADYEAKFGDESWELDALSPSYLRNLVTEKVEAYIDSEVKDTVEDEIRLIAGRIEEAADNFRTQYEEEE